MCGYLSKNFDEWEAHVTSEAHVEKLKRVKPATSVSIPPPVRLVQQAPQVTQIALQQQTSAPSIVPTILPTEELKDLTDKYQLKLNQDAILEILSKDKGKDKDWQCVHCNVKCQSQCSWDAHLASHKHRKNKHKFHVFPGISKEFVRKNYQNSFVRAAETIGKRRQYKTYRQHLSK
jgi:Zinc-finger of C2H2 type